jgi:hypothetical protein
MLLTLEFWHTNPRQPEADRSQLHITDMSALQAGGVGHSGQGESSDPSDLPILGVPGAEITIVVDPPPFLRGQMPWQRHLGEEWRI